MNLLHADVTNLWR